MQLFPMAEDASHISLTTGVSMFMLRLYGRDPSTYDLPSGYGAQPKWGWVVVVVMMTMMMMMMIRRRRRFIVLFMLRLYGRDPSTYNLPTGIGAQLKWGCVVMMVMMMMMMMMMMSMIMMTSMIMMMIVMVRRRRLNCPCSCCGFTAETPPPTTCPGHGAQLKWGCVMMMMVMMVIMMVMMMRRMMITLTRTGRTRRRTGRRRRRILYCDDPL
jgi:hypothetical protein